MKIVRILNNKDKKRGRRQDLYVLNVLNFICDVLFVELRAGRSQNGIRCTT
jgi:hypothetical protein